MDFRQTKEWFAANKEQTVAKNEAKTRNTVCTLSRGRIENAENTVLSYYVLIGFVVKQKLSRVAHAQEVAKRLSS